MRVQLIPLLILAACSRPTDMAQSRLVGTWEWRTTDSGGEFLAGEFAFAADGSWIELRLEPDHFGIAPMYARSDGVLYSEEEHLVDYSGRWQLVSEDADRTMVVMLSSWDPDRVVKRVYERDGLNALRCTEDERGQILVRQVAPR